MQKQRDTATLVKAVATVIREHVSRAIRSLTDRLDGFEAKLSALPVPKDGEPGKDGCNAFEVAVALGYEGTVREWLDSLEGKSGKDGERGADGLSGKDGKDGEPGPTGEKGASGRDGEKGDRGEIGPPGRDGVDGKDGAPGEQGAAGPAGERGEKGADGLPGQNGNDGSPGSPGERGEKGERGEAGQQGESGIDGKSITVDDIRPLVDDFLKSIPLPKDGRDGVAGKDGQNGRDGVDGKSVTAEDIATIIESAVSKAALDVERRGMDLIQRCIDRIPKPKDGEPGKDGRDAFDLEDIHAALADDGRTLTLAWVRGEKRVERSIVLPHVIYRGVHKQDQRYLHGDSVTFQGSTWIAMRDTSSKPETDDSWRLATKRGRDGKDGQRGEKGERGAPGRAESR